MSTPCSNEAHGRNGTLALLLSSTAVTSVIRIAALRCTHRRVAVADLLLRHLMAAAANALEDALDGELDGDDDHMQVHEVSGVHSV